MSDVKVNLSPDGRVQVTALSGSDGLRMKLDLELYGQIDDARSTWFQHSNRIDLTIVKAGTMVRWFQLLRGAKVHPNMQVDWSKYKDYDEELDEIEVKSGARGIPVPDTDPEMKNAVGDYWQRRRQEAREKGGMPDLNEVTKAADKAWEASDKKTSYQDLVQQMWKEATDSRTRERQLELDEDEWAATGGKGRAKDEM
ncbi:hypothetical protein T492DRAFT_943688 [Pavlovales sp. CCMP2436]|nr:hypothetical protein T492DRAFT_943688 [Pavlovales sp. CCMP2436]